MNDANLTGWMITEVTQSRRTRRVWVLIKGAKYEFTKFERCPSQPCKGVEIYDHPEAWSGMARFCGYLPEGTAAQFEILVYRHVQDHPEDLTLISD